MKSRITLLLVAVLSLAVLAGCGALSKAEYEKEMKAISHKAEKRMNNVGNSNSEKDIRKAADQLDDLADEVDDLSPPSEVEDLHDDLVQALHDQADFTRDNAPLVSEVLKGNVDQAKLDEVQKRADKLQKEIDRIDKAFEKKGYGVAVNA